MGWMIALFIVLGVLGGLRLRLPLFIVVSLVVVVLLAIAQMLLGESGGWVRLLVAVIALETGYVVGIVLRAGLRALRARGHSPGGDDATRRSRHIGR